MALYARIYVTPRKSVLDPQGKAVSGALHSLGYEEVEEVRAVGGGERSCLPCGGPPEQGQPPRRLAPWALVEPVGRLWH